MRRKITGVILLSLVCINTFIPQQHAQAEVCPAFNFQSIFFEEFYGTRWDNRAGSIEIAWSLNGTVILDENIVRKFSEKEQIWVREAFKSWDDALGSVSFKETTNAVLAQISIGLVVLNQQGAGGYWNSSQNGNWRFSATIKIKESIISSNELKSKVFADSDTFQRNWLIGIVQHELGNALGLGDIKPDSGVVSIQNDPFDSSATPIPLRASDVAMMRQLYGESTCPSTYTPAYKAAIEERANQAAEAKAAAELKAKQEAEAKAKAAAELKAKQEAEAKAKAAAELKAKQEAAADKAALANAQAELMAANSALLDSQKVNREQAAEINSLKEQFRVLSESVSAFQSQVTQLNNKLVAALANQNALNTKLKKVCSAKPKPKGC
jgi:hypothetical protein